MAKSNQTLKEEAFNKYYKLVPFLVQRMTTGSSLSDSDKEDLISAAYISLWEITKHYNPENEKPFKTYVYIRIKGSILDELRKKRNYLNRAALLAEQFKSQLQSYQQNRAVGKLEKCSPEIPGKGTQHEATDYLEEKDLLLKSLAKLPEKGKMLLEKHYLEGIPFRDIINTDYQVSKSWASKMHRESLQQLKEIYLQESEEERGI